MDETPSTVVPIAQSVASGVLTAENGEQAFGRALRFARNGDFGSAREALSLPTGAVDDDALVKGLMGLEEGLRLVDQDRQPEAAGPFATARAVLQHSTNEQLRFFIAIMADLAAGFARLLAGDAFGAHQLLDVSAETVKRLSFFTPALETLALSAKASSHIAMARFHTNVGDMQQVRLWMGRADAIHEQLLARLDRSSPEGARASLAIFAGRIEQIILLARLDLEALDLDAARDRLETGRTAYTFVQAHQRSLAPGALADVIALITGVYSVLDRMHKTLASSLALRRPLSREELESSRQMSADLRRLHDLGIASGQRGAGFLYTISQLARMNQSVLRLGKASQHDFGRLGGVITLGALVVIMFTIHLTMRPEGWTAFLFFFGATVVALIVGFGYGAVRFRSLLKQWTDLARSEPKADTPAADAGD